MSGIEKFGDGWEEFDRLVDTSKFAQVLPQSLKKGLTRVGQYFVRDARKAIQQKKYAANSPITIALKGSSTPLVNDGDLIGSLTADLSADGMTLWVGVNRNAKSKSGRIERVAQYLHDGAVIDCAKNPRVIKAVMAQLRESAQGTRRGNAAMAQQILDGLMVGSKKHSVRWVIKARPFIADVVESAGFDELCTKELQAAVEEAVGLSIREGT